MIHVHIHPHCCIVSNTEKGQQIALKKSEWSRLASVEPLITSFMCGVAKNESLYWILSKSHHGKTETRVTLNLINGQPFVNLRVWTDSQPTEQGVALSTAHWSSIKSALGCNDEAIMGRAIYTTMLTEKLLELRATTCEGCIRSWPSERDHECLMNTYGLTKRLLDDRPVVDPYAFVVRFAEKASEKLHRLERPMEAYDNCAIHIRELIDEDILDTLRIDDA